MEEPAPAPAPSDDSDDNDAVSSSAESPVRSQRLRARTQRDRPARASSQPAQKLDLGQQRQQQQQQQKKEPQQPQQPQQRVGNRARPSGRQHQRNNSDSDNDSTEGKSQPKTKPHASAGAAEPARTDGRTRRRGAGRKSLESMRSPDKRRELKQRLLQEAHTAYENEDDQPEEDLMYLSDSDENFVVADDVDGRRAVANADDDDDADDAPAEEVVRCICGAVSDNGYLGGWIQCSNELCEVWQHMACFGYRTKKEVPRSYLCELCRPGGPTGPTPQRQSKESLSQQPRALAAVEKGSSGINSSSQRKDGVSSDRERGKSRRRIASDDSDGESSITNAKRLSASLKRNSAAAAAAAAAAAESEDSDDVPILSLAKTSRKNTARRRAGNTTDTTPAGGAEDRLASRTRRLRRRVMDDEEDDDDGGERPARDRSAPAGVDAHTDSPPDRPVIQQVYAALKNGQPEVALAMLHCVAVDDEGAPTQADVNPDWICVHERTRTALHVAAERGYADVVGALLEAGADSSRVDLDNHTPMHLALQNDHIECFDALLADMSATASDGHLPLWLPDGNSLVHIAAAHSASRCLRAMPARPTLWTLLRKALDTPNDDGWTPLALAANSGSSSCLAILQSLGASVHLRTADGATLLHIAAAAAAPVQEGGDEEEENSASGKAGSGKVNAKPSAASAGEDSAVACLEWAIKACQRFHPNTTDNNNWPPLFYAAEAGNAAAARCLVRHGADLKWRDGSGTSALHLAALGGHTECVKTLIDLGHVVDCADNAGWPPLLYADFNAQEECVLALMRPKPDQLLVLSSLLHRDESEMDRRKTQAAVIRLITSLAMQVTYNRVLNDFIRRHPELLHRSFAFMLQHKGLLDFDNKLCWLRAKLQRERDDAAHVVSGSYHDLQQRAGAVIFRDAPLLSAYNCISNSAPSILRLYFNITFNQEEGMCVGPAREFFSILPEDLLNPTHSLFKLTESGQAMVPVAVYSDRGESGQPSPSNADRLRHMRFVGRLMGLCIIHGHHMNLRLAKHVLKLLLGLEVGLSDLADFDPEFYNSLEWIAQNAVDGQQLGATFSQEVKGVTGHTVTRALTKTRAADVEVTDANKDEYIRLMAKALLVDGIEHEVRLLREGLHEMVSEHLLRPFNADEMALLICGVSNIDIEDWKRNTVYGGGYTERSQVVVWFWEIVEGFTAEEKSLLLQFATGMPTQPPEGFANLQGLNGSCQFQVLRALDATLLPTAATCFNLLRLPEYSSKKDLQSKLFVALRHGSCGFTFS